MNKIAKVLETKLSDASAVYAVALQGDHRNIVATLDCVNEREAIILAAHINKLAIDLSIYSGKKSQ